MLKNDEYKFYKILIFAWDLKFYHWQQMVSVVFLEVAGLLQSLTRKWLPHTWV